MIKPLKIINCFLIVFLYWCAFEWTFLSFFKSIQFIYQIRIFIDLIPLILTIAYFMVNPLIISKINLKILVAVFLIVILALVSLLLEQNEIIDVFINIGVAIRFVPLILLTQNSDEYLKSKFIKHIKVIYWLQVILALFQLVSKSLFMNLFLPNQTIFDKITPSSYREFAINTTFINTIEFSFFIVALSIVYIISYHDTKKKWIIFFCSLTLVTLSLSTISILGMLVIGYYISKYKKIYPIIFLLPISLFVVLNQSVLFDFIGTKSLNQWFESSSKYSRIGYFTNLLPQFFIGGFKDLIIGMGVSPEIIHKKLEHYQDLPLVLTYGKNSYMLLKDVYWISIIISQGILGILLFAMIIKSLYTFAKNRLPIHEFIIIKLFILIIILFGFFNQVLDIKGFSYILWLTIGIFFNKTIKNEKIKGAYRGA